MHACLPSLIKQLLVCKCSHKLNSYVSSIARFKGQVNRQSKSLMFSYGNCRVKDYEQEERLHLYDEKIHLAGAKMINF
jgi:hypothetical protein